MNRREFWTAAAGATALSVLPGSLRSLQAAVANPGTTPLYVRGLAMVSLSDPDYLRIALPEAPHHQATMGLVESGGEPTSAAIVGNGRLIVPGERRSKPEIRIPSLVAVQELYPGAGSRIELSPSIISVPWSGVASVSAHTFTEDRWTFVEKESGREVITFRPRKLAESLRIDLVSSATLEMNNGDVAIDLSGTEEVWTEFVPTSHDMGGFTDHFAHYMPYVERPAGSPDLEPKQLTGVRTRPQPTMPAFANSFAPRLWPYYVCYPFQVD